MRPRDLAHDARWARNARRRDAGLTLVETMFAVGILVIVVGTVHSVALRSHKLFSNELGEYRVQDAGRRLMGRLCEELRGADPASVLPLFLNGSRTIAYRTVQGTVDRSPVLGPRVTLAFELPTNGTLDGSGTLDATDSTTTATADGTFSSSTTTSLATSTFSTDTSVATSSLTYETTSLSGVSSSSLPLGRLVRTVDGGDPQVLGSGLLDIRFDSRPSGVQVTLFLAWEADDGSLRQRQYTRRVTFRHP